MTGIDKTHQIRLLETVRGHTDIRLLQTIGAMEASRSAGHLLFSVVRNPGVCDRDWDYFLRGKESALRSI